jgi:hypothetical protein
VSDRLQIGRLIHRTEAGLDQARRLAGRAKALLRRGHISSRIEAASMLVRLMCIRARGRVYLAALRLLDTRRG